MSKMNWKKTGAVASAAVVAVSGAVASPAVMAFAETNADAQPLAAEALSDAAVAQGGAVAVENVEGSFTYSQATLTENSVFKDVFMAAATSLCASLPEGEEVLVKPISVCGAHTYMGTLDAMADEEGSTGFVMACSCASNGPGGGAIANAEVTGVSFESIAKLAGER